MAKIAPKKVSNTSLVSLIIAFRNNHARGENLQIIAIVLIVISLLATLFALNTIINKPQGPLDIYVGLDIGYGDEQTAMEQIDEVADYVNLIILGSLHVTTESQNLTRVCDHIFQKGLHFLIYVSLGQEADGMPPAGPDFQFFTNAKEKYGDQFLGVYLFDEVGGKLMDGAHSINVTSSNSYTEAAILYTNHLNFFLGNVSEFYSPAQFPIYTSDYALYWYNYLSGYDVVFTEYVGNQSRQIATGLCRGAAKSLEKDWGVIITWSDQLEPFVENPEQLYNDMVLAYQNGAKYIVVFNSPGQFDPPTEYGTLTPEHFEAMKRFWNYVNIEPAVETYLANTAYVIPRDYGYGFRGPEDKIWGEWQADNLAAQIWTDVQALLEMHVLSLDIVYETRIADKTIDLPYDRLIFWNGTIIQK